MDAEDGLTRMWLGGAYGHLDPGHSCEGKQMLAHAGVIPLHRDDRPPGPIRAIGAVGGDGERVVLWLQPLVADVIEGVVTYPRDQHSRCSPPNRNGAPPRQGGAGQLPDRPIPVPPVHKTPRPTWP